MEKPLKRATLLLRMGMLLWMLCISLAGYCQQATVTGHIVDNTGEAAIGATVLVKGTTEGTVTDIDGNFRITVKNIKNDILVISYVGYETQEIRLQGKKQLNVTLAEVLNELQEVTVVAYGVQKKETLTGAISSVKTDALLQSPNSSVANSLAGKITGLSSVQSSGQPGSEDPKIFIRGVGSLTESGGSPLILVDGVERSFFQMDPNEIENVTVLKDASATAVFGVRGANGVVLVTTRRGEKGKAKISVNSSVGIQQIANWVEVTDSYTYAKLYNETDRNDNKPKETFDDYSLERFRLGDEPVLYPNINWKDYMTKDAAVQTQHNLNISGGTEHVRYFISVGYMFQDGLMKDFGKGNGYKYNRYNYRTNLDLDVSKSTVLSLGIGGIVGDQQTPYNEVWKDMSIAQPFASPGLVDGMPMTSQVRYENIKLTDPFSNYYNCGTKRSLNNTMNLDLRLTQKLDFITKGLSAEIKGAYNTKYAFKKYRKGSNEIYTPYYESELDGSGLSPEDPGFNKNIVYRINGTNSKPEYSESTGRNRDWYFEASLRYSRKFGNHNVSGLLLYNQNKKYYPSQLTHIPTAYVGLVGRATYDYKGRYMAEFNIGYNGSENFAPEKRFGTFPAISLGWNISEEKFMKKQKFIDYLKLRASIGLVGNDNMSSNRFLYLPSSYDVDKKANEGGNWRHEKWGYNFGFNNATWVKGAVENRLGNKDVTWEKALKQNYGIDIHILDNRLKVVAEYFKEKRTDILISRKTIPLFTALSSSLLPVVNMGEVHNQGYEVEIGWNDKIGENLRYHINANVSYAKNKIIAQDEVEPNEPYLWRTGRQVGATFGYIADGFYSADDFVNGTDGGELKEGLPKPQAAVYPGDVKYRDLNNDGKIDPDDQCQIGYSTRPNYTFGLNYGAEYKGFFFSMNWTGTAQRSVALSDQFRKPFNGESRGLMTYQIDDRWTPENAENAKYPRFSVASSSNNYMTSTLWVKDGSYLKLKNFTIGYNFTNKTFLKKLGISQLGLKFTGYNLLTFSKMNEIMDPEFVASYNNTTYPVTRIYNLGMNITF